MIMKVLTFIALFIFHYSANAQKVALLDKSLKKPIIYTDSVTVEQVSKGYIPVEVKNIDSLYANLNYLMDMLNVRQRSKMQSFELRAGGTTIFIVRVPYAYGDRYNITMKSKIGEVESNSTISNQKKMNTDNAIRLQELMNYISKNISNFKPPNEITPKIYNIQVITDH